MAKRNGNVIDSVEAELAIQYRQRVIRYLQARGAGVEAEDLANDAFLILLGKIRNGGLEEPSKAGQYLYGIARNLFLDHKRKQARSVVLYEDFDIDAEGDYNEPQEALSRQQLAEGLNRLMLEMHMARDESALRRKYLYDQDTESICDDLDLTLEHLSRVLYRAKHRLKKAVTKSSLSDCMPSSA